MNDTLFPLQITISLQDASGKTITTDIGIKYVLESVPNIAGTVLPTIGIILIF